MHKMIGELTNAELARCYERAVKDVHAALAADFGRKSSSATREALATTRLYCETVLAEINGRGLKAVIELLGGMVLVPKGD